jgi:protein TonB
VVDGEGVEVELDLINKSRGQGMEAGDVDEKPSPNFPPPFHLPREIKKTEINARTTLSFCVDETGRVFDIQVVEENPPGMGMAQAGRNALQQTVFQPATKEERPVAFCGLEQPFEVKFDD